MRLSERLSKRRGFAPAKLRGVLSAGAATKFAVVALLLTGCQPGKDLPPLPPLTNTAYTLGPGDDVRIITFGEQTLTGEFTVEDSGKIAVPLLGRVNAAGMTTGQLGDEIDGLLRSKNLFRDPSVSVQIVKYRPIFVLGEVNKPGEFPYQPGMTVLSAVAIAGGFTYRAVEGYASVVRTEHDKPIEGRVSRDALLKPGDVVTVFERTF